MTSISVNIEKYKVFTNNTPQYLHMAENKIIIPQLLLLWNQELLLKDVLIQFLSTLMNYMPSFYPLMKSVNNIKIA